MKLVMPDVKIMPIADVKGQVYVATRESVWDIAWESIRRKVGIVNSQIKVPMFRELRNN